MEPDQQKFVVHEGLTDLEQMKLTMLKTVLRCSLRVLGLILAACVLWWLLQGLLWLATASNGTRT